MGESQSRQRVKGEVDAFGKLMAALTTLKRRDRVSEYDVIVYEERTAHIPLPLLSRAVTKWITTQQWFPTVAELLETCEAVRLEMRMAMAFTNCEQCSAQGWTVKEIDGVNRMVRCECWKAHQEKVKALGVPEQPLALPAASEFARAGETE
jgi:hypothetical protein